VITVVRNDASGLMIRENLAFFEYENVLIECVQMVFNASKRCSGKRGGGVVNKYLRYTF